jgi:N-dimethylarginine dimethylaminohydrolase
MVRPGGIRHSCATPPVIEEGWTCSEYDLLTEVMLASPRHLSLVPTNVVSMASIRNGESTSRPRADEQHQGLSEALTRCGAVVREIPPVAGLPDLTFARDSSFMTPWGLLGMRPGAAHRRGEVDAVLAAASEAGIPLLGKIEVGRVEGGDVCLMRPGHVAIGVSGERTDWQGAEAVGRLFAQFGWQVIYTTINPALLHLDTHFCMVDRELALGCVEELDAIFLRELARLNIEVIPVDAEEVASLGCNVLALGDRRILSSGGAPRVDQLLKQRGYEVFTVDLDEFTKCGGGVHCLTMPLRRSVFTEGRS